jgi:hypothetical protein
MLEGAKKGVEGDLFHLRMSLLLRWPVAVFSVMRGDKTLASLKIQI